MQFIVLILINFTNELFAGGVNFILQTFLSIVSTGVIWFLLAQYFIEANGGGDFLNPGSPDSPDSNIDIPIKIED